MKSVRYIIWILLAFVVIAVIDPQPDPPAVNPSTTLCKVLQHNSACNTVTQRLDSVTASSPFPVSLLAAEACEPRRPLYRLILTVQAADPSPPAPQTARTFIQS